LLYRRIVSTIKPNPDHRLANPKKADSKAINLFLRSSGSNLKQSDSIVIAVTSIFYDVRANSSCLAIRGMYLANNITAEIRPMAEHANTARYPHCVTTQDPVAAPSAKANVIRI
jgi:hypothetical protein